MKYQCPKSAVLLDTTPVIEAPSTQSIYLLHVLATFSCFFGGPKEFWKPSVDT